MATIKFQKPEQCSDFQKVINKSECSDSVSNKKQENGRKVSAQKHHKRKPNGFQL